MKLHELLLFGLCVAVPSFLLLILHPRDGITLFGEVTLQFPSFRETFTPGSDSLRQQVASIIESSEVIKESDPAELRRLDSLRSVKFRDSLRREQLKLHIPPTLDTALYPLFKKLDSINTLGAPLHIIHFGDSQIEGDRITDFFRFKMQTRFGGTGPGWLPAVPFVGSRSVSIENSENWQHYAMYGIRDSTIDHNIYGPLGIYGRFTPIPSDSLPVDTSINTATINYQSRGSAYQTAKQFERVRILYGNAPEPFHLKVLRGEQVIFEDTLKSTLSTQSVDIRLPSKSRSVSLEVRAAVSPDVYVVSLEGNKGILVDNVGLRGQSGTHFQSIPASQWVKTFENMETGLIILQFGGNTMPYVNDTTDIRNFTRRFGANIRHLRRFCKNCSVIVIGPADMARKESVEWETFPFLTEMRNMLKQTAFAEGAAYWDPCEAMGGEGAIQQWVLADPPLALADHIHFTIAGGELIAQWFYDALMREYEAYQQREKEKDAEYQTMIR